MVDVLLPRRWCEIGGADEASFAVVVEEEEEPNLNPPAEPSQVVDPAGFVGRGGGAGLLAPAPPAEMGLRGTIGAEGLLGLFCLVLYGSGAANLALSPPRVALLGGKAGGVIPPSLPPPDSPPPPPFAAAAMRFTPGVYVAYPTPLFPFDVVALEN